MTIKSLAAAWMVAGLVAAIDAVWVKAVGIPIIGIPEVGEALRAGLAMSIICGLVQYFARRVGCQLIAEVFRRGGALFGLASTVFALGIGFSTLSYLVIAARMPLIDGQLSRIDAMLGFNWLSWFDFVERYYLLHTLLIYIYSSTNFAIIGTLFYLTGTGRVWRYHEMLWLFIITLVVTITISGFFPSLHAPAYYLSANQRTAPTDLYHYLPDLFALREGTLSAIDLVRAQGLVCFPSYHTVMVIMFCYALRGTWLLSPALALGGLTMLSLPTIGGHYLVDIPGGAVVAVTAIWLVRHWSPERAGQRNEEVPRLARRPEPAYSTIDDPPAPHG